MNFRLQAPQDVVSRMIILEYLRQLDYNKIHEVLNVHQQKKMFYKFTDDDGKIDMDINWEYMFFEATMFELEGIAKNFLDEIEEIDNKSKENIKKIKKELSTKQNNIVTDIKPKLVGLDGRAL